MVTGLALVAVAKGDPENDIGPMASASSGRKSSRVSTTQNRPTYTSHNIWLGKPFLALNAQSGSILPAGTAISSYSVSRKAIRFTDAFTGKTYKMGFVGKYHPRIPIKQIAARLFTPLTFEQLTAGLTNRELELIREGTIEEGMSKRAALISLGYPPEHRTKGVGAERWTYWRTKRKYYSINFGPDERMLYGKAVSGVGEALLASYPKALPVMGLLSMIRDAHTGQAVKQQVVQQPVQQPVPQPVRQAVQQPVQQQPQHYQPQPNYQPPPVYYAPPPVYYQQQPPQGYYAPAPQPYYQQPPPGYYQQPQQVQNATPTGTPIQATPTSSSDPQLTSSSNRWAVVIGISDYKYSSKAGLTNLTFADDDARDFTNMLQSKGWSRSHIKLLTNKDATLRNVTIALESWLTKSSPDDLILLFWSGHGFPDPDDMEKVYFACYDTDLTIPATGYRMDRVHRALEERNSKNVVVMIDTCHAGKIATRGTKGISIVRHVEEIKKRNSLPKGWIYMVGADTDRQAIEHSSWSNGAFTHVMLNGLRGKADGFESTGRVDGIITMNELRSYMRSVMPDDTQRVLGVSKHPMITTSTGDPSIWDLTLFN